MAPKKPAKDAKPAVPEFVSLYERRPALPAPEPPNLQEAEAAWKASRAAFSQPLPEWDAEAVNTTEWKPNETTALFADSSFSAKALPRALAASVVGWKRAAMATEAAAPDEPEPQALPPQEPEEPPPPEKPDPKAKAKPDPKAKAKAGKAVEEVPTVRTTAQQFAECSYAGEARVVSQAEFRTRELAITNDDAMPPLGQSLASQFAVIAEHRALLPRGSFLWELIYPQDADGMPLYNPHGKYIVRLFLQGCWRRVVIDDVVPVGSACGSQAVHAPLLPSSLTPRVIWPQLLAKALLKAFQADLKSSTLPAITALTGWLPFHMPLAWEALKSAYTARPFCCLQLPSQVDPEQRLREAPLVPALSLGLQGPVGVPRLSAQPSEAPLCFLLCELEDDPQQVRVKAAAWRPVNGTPRKATKAAESEAEDEEEEEEEEDPVRPGVVEEAEDSEQECAENDEEEEDRRSQRSPSATGGEAGASGGAGKEPQSARSRGPTVQEASAEDEEAAEAERPWVCPWPKTSPAPMLLRSEIRQHHEQLVGGYWVAVDALRETCDAFVSYMPPGDHILHARLDTSWADGRKQAYAAMPDKLLRLKLVASAQAHQLGRSSADDTQKGEPWTRVLFLYEPLRPDPVLGATREVMAGPGGATSSCMLQLVNRWQPEPPVERPPEFLHLAVGDEKAPSGAGAGASMACRSAVLPPGEHWYLVLDDALRAGSSLSVHVEGLMLDMAKSSAEFLDPAVALEEKGVSVLALDPMEYPPQKGFSIWTKVELTLGEDLATSLRTLQMLTHLTDAALRPHLQLTVLRFWEPASGEAEDRAAGWSVKTLLRAPLLRLMSLPLIEPESAVTRGSKQEAKYILVLEANVPSPARGGNFSLQMWLPTPSGGSLSPSRGSAPALPKLQPLRNDVVLRWSGDSTPNDKGLVLCERITVPPGGGAVSATLRIAVSGIAHSFLRASLVAQLPPREDMKPPRPEGASTPEPRPPGAPIDPRDYGGRRNWLASCRPVLEAEGAEAVTFPHVVLAEASVYLLYVHLDPFKGSANPEGGHWLVEMFSSGEVEMGADTMEQDLEVLVRRSWEDPAQEVQPPRKETAAASRQRWLAKRASVRAEEADAGGVVTGQLSNGLDLPPEEAAALAAALERAASAEHANGAVADFLRSHTSMPPVLVEEDPWTVVPDLPLHAPGTAEVAATEAATDLDGPIQAAINAFSASGLQASRQAEIDESVQRWELAHEGMAAAKERNVKALQELKVVREELVRPPPVTA